jgi:hypothetical protein
MGTMSGALYEKEAEILKAALKAGLPGKWLGGTITPDQAGFRWEVDGYAGSPISVTISNGNIRIASEGLPSGKGGFSFYDDATKDKARELAARAIEWVKSH